METPLKTRTAQQWISVKEHLPEVGKYVLLYFSADDMAIASYHPTFQQWGRRLNEVWVIDGGDDISQTIELYRPTHWMSLPESPQS